MNGKYKFLAGMKGITKLRGLGMKVRKKLYMKVIVLTVMRKSEIWGMHSTEKRERETKHECFGNKLPEIYGRCDKKRQN